MPNTTLSTITDYITDGRDLIQDTLTPFRYSDDSLVTAMNVTLLEGRRLRPDLFVYRRRPPGESQVQHMQANDGTKIDIEEQFRLAFLFGMCAHALMRDQEDIQDERAGIFMSTFTSILIGKSITPPVGGQ